jgi:hypothetical protein
MERLTRIKNETEFNHFNMPETGVFALAFNLKQDDFDWLIEQAEKVERYEKALKWIVENFDSDKSGLSDEEYHKEMIKKANESLKC